MRNGRRSHSCFSLVIVVIAARCTGIYLIAGAIRCAKERRSRISFYQAFKSVRTSVTGCARVEIKNTIPTKNIVLILKNLVMLLNPDNIVLTKFLLETNTHMSTRIHTHTHTHIYTYKTKKSSWIRTR